MNGQKSVDPIEATQFLKDMLNVGKSQGSNAVTSPPSTSAENVANGSAESIDEKSYNGKTGSDLLNSLLKASDHKIQQIHLPGSNEDISFPIYGNEVSITPSPLHTSGSSKVKIHNIVDYKWENKFYQGRMVAVHLSGVYLAYTISTNGGGVVRVIKQTTGERDLIKGMKGEVKDLGFAFTKSPVLLACVDEIGDIFVYEVIEKAGKIMCRQNLWVERDIGTSPSNYHRIIWCPYIPEDPTSIEEDARTLLLVTNESQAEIWNLEQVNREHSITHFTPEQLPLKGVLIIAEHTMPISDASFSPDGTALATASLDGEVKFFQVQSNDAGDAPRCLHQWCPHERKPLSCLFFLDNIKVFNPDVQFWKYAITGANNNQELKLWSCETWSCLQTIRFVPSPDDKVTPCLIASIDLTSTYLLLSDINRKVLYILQIAPDFASNKVMICSISEFPLAFPVLSMAVGDFIRCRYKQPYLDVNATEPEPLGLENNLLPQIASEGEGDEDDDDQCKENYVEGTVAKIFWIQPRSLQMCNIVYQPPDLLSSPSDSYASLPAPETYMIPQDQMSDVAELRDVLNTPSPRLRSYNACSEVLLTPEDFTSSTASTVTPNTVCPSNSSAEPPPSAPPIVPSKDSESILVSSRRKSSQHSSTSSPSREVEEIMASKKFSSTLKENHLLVDKDDEVPSTLVKKDPDVEMGGLPEDDFQAGEWPQVPDATACLIPTTLHSSQLPKPPSVPSGDQNEAAVATGEQIVKLEQALKMVTTQLSDHITQEKKDFDDLKQKIIATQDQIQALMQRLDDNQKFKEKAAADETSQLESFLSKREQLDQQWLEKQANQLSHSFGSKLEKCVRNEMKSVTSSFTKFLEETKHQLEQEVAQKLTATDALVKDHIAKLLKTKLLSDSISSSLSNLVQNHVQTSFREAFQSTAIPHFEKACQNLFLQLNESFQKGTKEYINQLESTLDHQVYTVQTTTDKHLVTLKEQMKLLTEQSIKSSLASLQSFFVTQLQDQIIKNQDTMVVKLRGLIQEELKASLTDTAALRSAAATPTMDTQFLQQQLRQLVRRGQYNTAFQQALSASDLNLVTLVCTAASPEQVFDPQANDPLQQPVLLSLIQQLSGDLNTNTDLKLCYLENAISSLDMNNVVTREHVAKVLSSLQHKLSTYMHAYPKSPSIRKMKLILMATCSLTST